MPGRAVPFEVSLDGRAWTRSGLGYTYRYMPAVGTVVPPALVPIWAGGGGGGGGASPAAIRVVGRHLHPSLDLTCRFDARGAGDQEGILRPAAVGGDGTAVECPPPPLGRAGTVLLDVLAGGIVLPGGPLSVAYVASISPLRLWPSNGPMRGGTLVRIALGAEDSASGPSGLASLAELGGLWCRFSLSPPPGDGGHGQLVLTSPIMVGTNSSALECAAPDATSAALSLSPGRIAGNRSAAPLALLPAFVGVGAGEGGSLELLSPQHRRPYLYRDAPTSFGIWPRLGMVGGGTAVRIAADGFGGWIDSGLLRCRFGALDVEAVLVSPNTLECISPRAETDGSTALSVSENGVDYAVAGDYAFVPTPKISSLVPSLIFAGEGATLSLRGTGFVESDGAVCRIWTRGGSTQITLDLPASVVSNDQAYCEIPFESLAVGDYTVSMLSNGLDELPPSSLLRVVERPIVNSISPLSGAVGIRTKISFGTAHSITPSTLSCVLNAKTQLLSVGEASVGSDPFMTCPVTCPADKSNESKKLAIAIAGNVSGNSSFASLPFWCDPLPAVRSVRPRAIAASTNGTRLEVKGSGFRHRDGISCHFTVDVLPAGLVVPAEYLGPEKVACKLPFLDVPEANVGVRVSNNGQNIEGTPSSFIQVRPSPSIAGVYSRAVTVGSTVRVRGVNFVRGMLCKVGEKVATIILFESETMLSCRIPSDIGPEDGVSLQLSLDGNTFTPTTTRASVNITPRPQILSVTPSISLTLGGALLHVNGLGFSFLDDTICRFGEGFDSIDVGGVRDIGDRDYIICETPPGFKRQLVPMRILGRGEDQITEAATIAFVDPVRITHLSPSSGPIRGGTKIIIHALSIDFTIPMFCSIEGTIVVAEILSRKTVGCFAPSSKLPGVVDLKLVHQTSGTIISIPQQTNSTAFTYYDEPAIFKYSPVKGSLRGGDAVTIQGNWVLSRAESETCACRFGNTTTAAYILRSKHAIVCKSPPAPLDLSVVNLSISLNGVDFASSSAQFEYSPDLFVRSISPASGSIDGGTIVSIIGNNVELAAGCRFDGEIGYLSSDKSSTALSCVTPKVNSVGMVELFLQNYELNWIATGQQYTYEEPMIIHDVSPKVIAPETDILRVHGDGFLLSGVFCSLGGRGENSLFAAEYKSPKRINCPIPSSFPDIEVPGGNAILSITSNMQEFVEAPFLLPITSGIGLTSAFPLVGPSVGGTNVTIVGSGFMKNGTILCWFGKAATMAKYHSESMISCPSSASYLKGGVSTSSVNLAISQDSDRSRSSISFSYFSSRAAISPGTTVIPGNVDCCGGSIIRISSRGLNALLNILEAEQSCLDLVVKLNSTEVDAKKDATGVYFAAPMFKEIMVESVVPLSLSLNGGVDYITGLSIQIYPTPTLSSVEPAVIDVGDNIGSIVVHGSNFLAFHEVACRIGDIITNAVVFSSKDIECQVPAEIHLGITSVAISLNGLDYTNVSLPIIIRRRRLKYEDLDRHVLSPLFIANVEPTFGSSSRAFQVAVTGEFDDDDAYTCITDMSTNETAVSAMPVDRRSIICHVPASTRGPGSYTLQIMRISDRALSNRVGLSVTEDTILKALSPQVMPESGGNLLVHGDHFEKSDIFHCLLQNIEGGPIILKAIWTTEKSVQCGVPPLPVGNATVSIMQNGHDPQSNSLALFVRPLRRLLAISPSVGAVQGGTNVSIAASGLSHYSSSKLFCTVGRRRSEMIIVNDTFAKCSVPPSYDERGGPSNFYISDESAIVLNSSVSHDNSSQTFYYRNAPFAKRISPVEAPASGGTVISVTVSDPLDDWSGPVLLRFVSRSNTSLSALTVLSPREVNATAHSLVLPPSPDGGNGGMVTIELSLNGQDYSSGETTFNYVKAPLIHRIYPTIAPEMTSIHIAIHGENFGTFNQIVACTIGTQRFSAIMSGPDLALCSINDQMAVGNHDVGFSLNGKDFVTAPRPLQLKPLVRLHGASPLLGGVRGGTKISVRGTGFKIWKEQLMCSFGSKVLVSPIIFNNTALECTTPRKPKRGDGKLLLSLVAREAGSDPLPITKTLDNTAMFRYYEDEALVNLEPKSGPTAGGTIIKVRGRWFRDSRELSCKVGAAVPQPAVFIKDDLVECPVPPAVDAFGSHSALNETLRSGLAITNVFVSNNGIDFPASEDLSFQASLSFAYYSEPTLIISKNSLIGPPEGGTLLIVSGDGIAFPTLTDPVCMIGRNVSKARVSVVEQSIQCISPPGRTGTKVKLRISLNGGHDFYKESFDFRYIDSPIVRTVIPELGPTKGDHLVTLFGNNFYSRPEVNCRFGNIMALAKVTSSEIMTCIVPPNKAGSVKIEFLWEGDSTQEVDNVMATDYPSGLAYTYIDDIRIDKLEPSHGPLSGGTSVSLTVSQLDALFFSTTFFCVFDSTYSTATIVSRDTIKCKVPPQSDSGAVLKSISVSVGIQGSNDTLIHLSDTHAQYSYYEEPDFVGLNPRRTSRSGGARIAVVASRAFFSLEPMDTMACRFMKSRIVKGEFVGDSTIVCTAPDLTRELTDNDLQTIRAQVEVSFNGHDYHSAGWLDYDDTILVTSIIPSHGPSAGGTKVLISGVGYPGLFETDIEESMECAFGERRVSATYINSTFVECVAPSHAQATVSVSLVYFSGLPEGEMRSESLVAFTFVNTVDIASTFPSMIPFSGTNEEVYLEVYGSGFLNQPTLACAFEVFLRSNATKRKRRYHVGTGAVFHNATFIECGPGIPSLADTIFDDSSAVLEQNVGQLIHDSKISVSVTTNGQDWTSDTFLEFIAAHQITSIHPSIGPYMGGTRIIVTGKNFAPSRFLACSFGPIIIVPAEFRSDSEIVCETPQGYGEKSLPVKVTVNGHDFSSSSFPFLYHEPLILESITPKMAPSAGGVIVNVSVADKILRSIDSISSSFIYCRFNATMVKASILDSETIACISPAAHANGGTVGVDVSINDGIDFSENSLMFHFTHGQLSGTIRLTPSHGPTDGGTLIRVDGLMGLGVNRSLLELDFEGICRFGEIIVPALFIADDGTSMHCVSPSLSSVGHKAVAVDVAFLARREALTTSGVLFIYDDKSVLVKLHPSTGSTLGGTSVKVSGGPFIKAASGELKCRFGHAVVSASWHSKQEISCTTPPASLAGGTPDTNMSTKFAVDVSSNGVDFTSSSLSYTYHPVVELKRLEPNRGPTSGGSIFLVRGVNFQQNNRLTCVFWQSDLIGAEHLFTVSKFHNSSTISCRSPPTLRPSTFYVYVSINGFEPHPSLVHLALKFTYYAEPAISSVSPPFGPSSGNSSIIVSGGPFALPDVGAGQFKCRFGNAIVSAMYLDKNRISCLTPPSPPGVARFEVTQNDQDYSNTDYGFEYYEDVQLSHIEPRFGPANRMHEIGTEVNLFGKGFINSTHTICRFDDVSVPARYVHDGKIVCSSRVNYNQMEWIALDQVMSSPDDSTPMFERAHSYPYYLGRSVMVAVSNNGQDFAAIKKNFLVVEDITLDSISSSKGAYTGGTPIFITGAGFVNNTALCCRIGTRNVNAYFLSRSSILCFTPPQAIVGARDESQTSALWSPSSKVALEVSNNGVDFTKFQHSFQYTPSSPHGYYQPGGETETLLKCPRGSFCREGSSNFTLCPMGSYQHLRNQGTCLSCPLGYHCPSKGLHVPRICPAGFVCDEIGIELAKQPCPVGHACAIGTVTSLTTCSQNIGFGVLMPKRFLRSSAGFGQVFGQVFGSRNSACFDNSTDDFGLQASDSPGRFWAERHLLPLDVDAPISPNRGRFCLDDSCIVLEDASTLAVSDASFDYSSTGFALRRPVPCLKGTYCFEGTALNETSAELVSTTSACFDSMYCPEGSVSPYGMGKCPSGHFCVSGVREQCPVGSFCPEGSTAPRLCLPGSFNFQLGQRVCSICPLGYYCPGYGRVDPAICPNGFICSKIGLDSPNIRCPSGFYCPSGTQTSDPFRNDTTLRPYACAPGTYCTDGVGYEEVKEGDLLFAQPCAAGFYCEAAATSPVGMGQCPPGFVCPKGTAFPKPTPKGYNAEHFGTIYSSACLPGYYAPTIQTDQCYPCPQGFKCDVDGLVNAEICPPGTYRSAFDGTPCLSCPGGTWSKQWGLREVGECIRLPPGVKGPQDSMTSPCSRSDLPTPYEPVVNLDGVPSLAYLYPASQQPPHFSVDECLGLNPSSLDHHFRYGELIPPYIDILGRGAFFRSTDDNNLMYAKRGRCYRNLRPLGTILYQRMKDYHGPQIDIQNGRSMDSHQGYGVENLLRHVVGTVSPSSNYDFVLRYHREGAVDIPKARRYDPSRNCTPGFFLYNESIALLDRHIVFTSKEYDALGQRQIVGGKDQYYPGTCEADIICVDGEESQAEPCSDGKVCDENTSEDTHPCAPGYVCKEGTTPDIGIKAPAGQFSNLCPEAQECDAGTGEITVDNSVRCPRNYFCPPGVGSARLGLVANDFLNREVDPVTVKHERDRKSSLVADAIRRRACNCTSQMYTLAVVYRLWQCTSNMPLTDFGFGALQVPISGRGRRDFWFNRIHKDYELAIDMDPAMEGHGLKWGNGSICKWPDSDLLSITEGKIPGVVDGLISMSPPPLTQISVRLSQNQERWFSSYDKLKLAVRDEYSRHFRENTEPTAQNAMDPFVFDLQHAVNMIERFGAGLQSLIKFRDSRPDEISVPWGLARADFLKNISKRHPLLPQRLDVCECQHLLKCPNGTHIEGDGATSIHDCKTNGDESLRRVSMLPPDYFESSTKLDNATDFFELGGGDVSNTIGTLKLDPYEVAIFQVQLSGLPTKLKYGDHYRIAIYSGCKPCPLRYRCDLNGAKSTQCNFPKEADQLHRLNECLRRERTEVCVKADGSDADIKWCQMQRAMFDNGTEESLSKKKLFESEYLIYTEPNLHKCLSMPYFCGHKSWNYRTFRRLCQDQDPGGGVTSPYDCSLNDRWHEWQSWSSGICCSEEPEFSNFDACNHGHCSDDPLIQNILKDKFVLKFIQLHGFEAPNAIPNGTFIMNASIQEALHDRKPLDLFNQWQGFNDETENTTLRVHNPFKPWHTNTWRTIEGCCRCQPQLLPAKQNSSDYPEDEHQIVQFTISALDKVHLTVVCELLHGQYLAEFDEHFSPLNKSKMRIHLPTAFAKGTENESFSWVAVLDKEMLDKSSLALPLNLPLKKNRSNIYNTDSILIDRPTALDVRLLADAISNIRNSKGEDKDGREMPVLSPTIDSLERANAVPQRREFSDEHFSPWDKEKQLILPYLPFFSNCDDYGSHIGISRLLEDNPSCTIFAVDEIKPVSEYRMFSKEPNVSDYCQDKSETKGIDLLCHYEEDIASFVKEVRWYESGHDTTLFEITRNAFSSTDFAAHLRKPWEVTSGKNPFFDSRVLVPVVLDAFKGGMKNVIPRVVKLELAFYQVNKYEKRLVEAFVSFEDLCTTHKPVQSGGNAELVDTMAARGIDPCEIDGHGNLKSAAYVLRVDYHSLGWLSLLNTYQFKPSVYLIIFTLAGIAGMSLSILIWATSRLMTRSQDPPPLRLVGLARLVGIPSFIGCVISSIPIAFALSTMHLPAIALKNIDGLWKGSLLLDETQITKFYLGRTGAALFTLGIYLSYLGTKVLSSSCDRTRSCGKHLGNDAIRVEHCAVSDSKGALATWRRSRLLCTVFGLEFLLLVFLEFSYSFAFERRAVFLVVAFKVLQLGIRHILCFLLEEELLVAPFSAAIQLVGSLISIGSSDLFTFVLCNFTSFAFTLAERLIIEPALMRIKLLWTRWMLILFRRYAGRLNFEGTEEEEWNSVNERIEMHDEGAEPLIEALGTLGPRIVSDMLAPLVFLAVIIFRQAGIAEAYGKGPEEMAYYVLYAVYMLPWAVAVDCLMLNTQEVMYGWQIFDYLSYQRHRFSTRQHPWMLASTAVDESIPKNLQSLDLLCFSSQYYVIIVMLAAGILITMFGVTVMLRSDYNMLGDPATSVVTVATMMVCYAIQRLSIYASTVKIDSLEWRGLWATRGTEGALDDDVAARLAVGLGSQADLETERKELAALKSEQFRLRFLDRNRPWILRHLLDLLPPEVVSRLPPEHIRRLRNLHNPPSGCRGDISSDSDTESEEAELKQREMWERSFQEEQCSIIKEWLGRATKRLQFARAVRGMMEGNMAVCCSFCGRTDLQCQGLSVSLADDSGQRDINGLDRLIRAFELANPQPSTASARAAQAESILISWKAFFRTHAGFVTICNLCREGRCSGRWDANSKAIDISSDEDSDDGGSRSDEAVDLGSQGLPIMREWLGRARARRGADADLRSAGARVQGRSELPELPAEGGTEASQTKGSNNDKDS